MTIRTHAHTADHTAACTIRTGYATYAGARRWVDTHAAPSGHCYGVVTTPGTPAWAETYDIVCDTIDGQSDGTVPTHAPTDTDPMCDTCPIGDAPHTYASHLDDPDTDALTPGVDDTAPSADYTVRAIRGDGSTYVDTIDTDAGEIITDAGEIVAYGTHRVELVADGTYVSHAIVANGTYGYTTRTYTGTLEHVHTDAGTFYTIHTDRGTVASVSVLPGAHVVAVDVTGAPIAGPTSDIVTAPDTDTYTGTYNTGTGTATYTVTTDGTTTVRTYAYPTGWMARTYADDNHMWLLDTPYAITYVVAEGTYWRTDGDDNTQTTSVSWATAGGRTCGHNHAGYGACIAPYGHPHTDHIDANGNRFTGVATTPYVAPIGCDIPDTYTRVVSRMAFARDTYRTVLRPDVLPMVRDYRNIMHVLGIMFDTYGSAYAAIVRGMPNATYEPTTDHYDTYAWLLDTHYAVND